LKTFAYCLRQIQQSSDFMLWKIFDTYNPRWIWGRWRGGHLGPPFENFTLSFCIVLLKSS